MSLRAVLGWGLAAVLLTAAPQVSARQQGVMLGLQYNAPIEEPLPYYAGSADSLSRPAYRTLLLSHADSTFVMHASLDHLLIPQGDRFWRVDTKRSVYNNWVEDFIWSARDGAAPELAGIQAFNGEYCEGHRSQTIWFAGPRYLSVNQQSAGYCEGATHPWFFNTLAVVPIDSTTHPGVDIDDVLGAAALQSLDQATAAFLDDNQGDEPNTAFFDAPDPANWGMRHDDGGWNVFGRLDAAEEAAEGRYADLPLDINPGTLTGPSTPADLWAGVQAFAPDAVDALLAPSADWLVVLHPGSLTLHPIRDTTVGPSFLTYLLPEGARVVMARWSDGRQLLRWIDSVEQLAARAH